MGQAAELTTASADLLGASIQYTSSAADLEEMVGTMSGVVHGLLSQWSGLGSQGFVSAWKQAARDAYRAIDSLGGTAGAMKQLSGTIDDNVGAIRNAEILENGVPHGADFGQRLLNAQSQSSQALSTISKEVSSLAGQLQQVVVPLTIGGCSTGLEPLYDGQFDGVTVQPQADGPNGPPLPPGLVALMDGPGGGNNPGSSNILRFLTAAGVAAYQTYPTFKEEGYRFDGKVMETYTINFVVDYATGPEASLKGSAAFKYAGFAALEALLQTAPEVQKQREELNGNVDPAQLSYVFLFHFTANMALDAAGDKVLTPQIGPNGTIVGKGMTDAQLDQLVGDPEKLRKTLEKIFSNPPYSGLPPDTAVPQPSPGPSAVPPGSQHIHPPTSPHPPKSPTSSKPTPIPTP